MLLRYLLIAAAIAEPPALVTAKQLYFEALEGNSAALDKSVEILTSLAARDGGNPTVTAYLGSARLLESARTLAVWKKGKLAKEGLEMLDRAVEAAPKDLEIRFLRAATCYRLPGWFKRGSQSEKDFAFLAPRAEAAAKTGELDARLAAAAVYFWGEIRERNDDVNGAKEAWGKAVKIAPESRAGVDAAKKLARL